MNSIALVAESTVDVATWPARRALAAALLRLAQDAPFTVHRWIDRAIERLECGQDPAMLAQEAAQSTRHAIEAAAFALSREWALPDGATPAQLRERARFFRSVAQTLRGGLAVAASSSRAPISVFAAANLLPASGPNPEELPS